MVSAECYYQLMIMAIVLKSEDYDGINIRPDAEYLFKGMIINIRNNVCSVDSELKVNTQNRNMFTILIHLLRSHSEIRLIYFGCSYVLHLFICFEPYLQTTRRSRRWKLKHWKQYLWMISKVLCFCILLRRKKIFNFLSFCSSQ